MMFQCAGGACVISSSLTVPENVWVLIGYVYSGASEQVTFYEGEDGGTLNSETDSVGVSLNTVQSGGTDILSDVVSYYLNGNMDDLALWNDALTSTQVSDMFDSMSGTPSSYYATVEDGTHNLRDATNTASDILKTLPPDWIIQVVSTTDQSDNQITNSSGTWYGVVDPTDGATGWMVATTSGAQYISSYDGSAQAALEASSSDQIATGTAAGDTADYIVDAVEDMYTSSSVQIATGTTEEQ